MSANTAMPSTISMGRGGSRLNIKLKRGSAGDEVSTARHTPIRSSALSQEIKVEDDEDTEMMDDDEEGMSDRARSSSVRESSATLEADDGSRHQASPSTPGTISRASPESLRRAVGRPKGSGLGPNKGTPKSSQKNKNRTSVVSSILGLSQSNDAESDVRQAPAPISSTSGVVASALKLSQQPDGSIDMDKLEPDERRALLRPAGLDVWPDVLTPFVESIQPLHPDLQAQVGSLARPPAQVVDGFAASMLSEPASSSVTQTYDVSSQPSEKAMAPFAVSSGWTFGDPPSVPLSWPQPTASGPSAQSNSQSDPSTPIRALKGRDREKEREAAGASNLEDWTFPRAHMARLLLHSDVGTHPGVLPAAWVSHIVSSKGGPAVSRLPPFHLAAGQTLQNALHEELAYLPSRALLGLKPGGNPAVASSTESQDLVTTIEASMANDWRDSEAEIKQKGVKGSDAVREAVYGGVIGESYARSVDDFVTGAMQMAADRDEERNLEIEEEEEREAKRRKEGDGETGRKGANSSHAKRMKKREALRMSSYFDTDGEIKDGGDYIGVSIIPFDVRKEAGSGIKQEGGEGQEEEDEVKPLKRKRDSSTPGSSRRSASIFADRNHLHGQGLQNGGRKRAATGQSPWTLEECILKGRVLDRSLRDYVRDTVVSPLTGGLLDVLVRAGGERRETLDEEALRKALDGSALDEELLDVLRDLKDQVGDESALPTPAPNLSSERIDSLTSPRSRKLEKQLAELVRGGREPIDLDSLLQGPQDMLPSQHIRRAGVAETLRMCAPLLVSDDINRKEEIRQILIDLAKQAPSQEIKKGQWLAWIQMQQALAVGRS